MSAAAGSVGVLDDNGCVTTYGAEYLNRLLDAVTGFQDAFDAWMTTQVESDHLSARGLFPTTWTREGEDETKVKQLELAVAEAAGAAARAVAITGAYIAVQGIGPIDPIANWSMMRNPKAFLSPQDVRTTAATVKGRLQAMVSDAEAERDVGHPSLLACKSPSSRLVGRSRTLDHPPVPSCRPRGCRRAHDSLEAKTWARGCR